MCNIHDNMYGYTHDIRLHYSTLHNIHIYTYTCITLHYIPFHCITLHYITYIYLLLCPTIAPCCLNPDKMQEKVAQNHDSIFPEEN